LEKNKYSILPQSDEILKKAKNRGIDDIFKLLLSYNNSAVDKDVDLLEDVVPIEKSGNDVDWTKEMLNLNLIQVDLLVDEVKDVIMAMIKELKKQNNTLNKTNISESNETEDINLIINFTDFKNLILKCLYFYLIILFILILILFY
jgi:hypothetical protein